MVRSTALVNNSILSAVARSLRATLCATSGGVNPGETRAKQSLRSLAMKTADENALAQYVAVHCFQNIFPRGVGAELEFLV